MNARSLPAVGVAAAVLVLVGASLLWRHRSASMREFEAGARFGRSRPADACLNEIRDTSLAGRRSFLGLADQSFAAGCFGAAEGNVWRCLAIPPAQSEEGYAWRTEFCGEIQERTTDCHVQFGVIQDWCDQAHPVD